jgi:hypothetical protein
VCDYQLPTKSYVKRNLNPLAGRVRLAGEDKPVGDLVVVERVASVHFHATFLELSHTGGAGAGQAGVGRIVVSFHEGVEDGLSFFQLQLDGLPVEGRLDLAAGGITGPFDFTGVGGDKAFGMDVLGVYAVPFVPPRRYRSSGPARRRNIRPA